MSGGGASSQDGGTPTPSSAQTVLQGKGWVPKSAVVSLVWSAELAPFSS